MAKKMADLTKDKPAAASEARAGLTGLEYVRAIRDGAILRSPLAQTIGWTFETAEEGLVTLSLQPKPHIFGNNSLHGGAIASLIDGAMSAAVNSVLPRGYRCLTLN